MRTTLTINDDILDQLKAVAAKERGKPFKEVVNETLRLGLKARRSTAQRKPFKITSKKMGLVPGVNYDKTQDLLDHAEGVDRKW
jgi:hypothetical protein